MVLVQKGVHCPGKFGVNPILDFFVCFDFCHVTVEV
jgi:hypothetical protein